MKPTEELHANEGRVLSATFTLPDLGKSCPSLTLNRGLPLRRCVDKHCATTQDDCVMSRGAKDDTPLPTRIEVLQ
jgi:hypothetical protein